MEKSAFRTILAQGPSQAAGGVKVKGLGEKSAKTSLVKSGTTHGVVSGRGTGGSAVAVLADPITRPGGGMLCAESMQAASSRLAVARILAAGFENDLEFPVGLQVVFIGPPR